MRREQYGLLALASIVWAGLILQPAATRADDRSHVKRAGIRITVEGNVTDQQGMPLPGAKVSAIYRGVNSQIHSVSRQADAQGDYRFELSSVTADDLTVVAWLEGYAFGLVQREASILRPREWMSDGARIELPISLPKPETLSLRIIGNDGQPVSGEISVVYIYFPDGRSAFYDNRVHLDYLTRQITADGHALINYLAPGYRLGLRIGTNREEAAQVVTVPSDRAFDDAVVQLLPWAKLDLRLTASDANAIRNREITVRSRPEKPAGTTALQLLHPSYSVATAQTDEQGRATIATTAGKASIQLTPHPDDRQFLQATTSVDVAAHETTEFATELVDGVKVSGQVATDEKEPVAGVHLRLAGTTVTTADDGRFEGWVPPSQMFARVVDVPPGFVWPFEARVARGGTFNDSREPSNDAANKVILPVIRVKKAVPVEGTVVGDDGKPVPFAQVKASWVQTHDVHSYFTLKSDATQSDPEGRFELHHVHGNVDVRITAETPVAATHEATIIHTDGPQETCLHVSPDAMIRLRGSASGSDGPRIAHAEIKIVRALLAPNGRTYGTRPLTWNGQRTFRADETGRIESPGTFPRFGRYSVTISASDYLAAETSFLTAPESGAVLDLGDIELTRARTVGGWVRDSSGNPIADALVWSHAAPVSGRRYGVERTEGRTDDQGRFTLRQLHPLAAVAVVEKEGFRTSGCGLLREQAGVRMTLFRTDETVPPQHAIRPLAWDLQRRHAAARQLLENILPQRRASSFFHGEALKMLARFDPAAALAETALSESASTRAKTLAVLGEIPDALAEAETINDGYSRAFARFAILDHIQDPLEARDVLASTLLDAQSIRKPERRTMVIANVADRFADLGDERRAAEILQSELPRANALSTKEWPGYARGSFAKSLARFDPETALNMVAEADAKDQTRHLQNIAHSMASIKPGFAESVLKKINEHRYVDDPAVRIAYRMASVDLPRAVRVLDLIDQQLRPTERARGLGVVAMAVHPSNPQEARKRLSQAFAAIPEQRGGGGSRTDDIVGAAITLLRFAEQVDPDNLTDYYWQAISHHPGPEGGAWSPDNADEENAERQSQLALLISLYDHPPGLTEQIMEPVFEYWEQKPVKEANRFSDREASFMAMALTSPERAVEWAIRFDEQLDREMKRRIPQPWQVIGHTLTQDRESIGQAITREVFHRWIIDQFDL